MRRSVELAAILDSLLTGAEYLREFDRLAEMKDNPLARASRRSCRMSPNPKNISAIPGPAAN